MIGFVYLWFDRHRRMFYVGSHKGSPDDGYVCSNKRMLSAYCRRPQDFKRRILEEVNGSYQELLAVEQRWLNLIDLSKNRYYNLKLHASGGNGTANKGVPKKKPVWNKGLTKETCESIRIAATKQSQALRGRPKSTEHKNALRKSRGSRGPYRRRKLCCENRYEMRGPNAESLLFINQQEIRLYFKIGAATITQALQSGQPITAKNAKGWRLFLLQSTTPKSSNNIT